MIWLRMCFFMLNQSRGKILSVVVPCYNSAEYMGKCIESLLIGGDRVEIIVVNDGSSDGTHDIACKYQEKYPNIIIRISCRCADHVVCVVLYIICKYNKNPIKSQTVF